MGIPYVEKYFFEEASDFPCNVPEKQHSCYAVSLFLLILFETVHTIQTRSITLNDFQYNITKYILYTLNSIIYKLKYKMNTNGIIKLCVNSRKYRRRIAFWASTGRFACIPWKKKWKTLHILHTICMY